MARLRWAAAGLPPHENNEDYSSKEELLRGKKYSSLSYGMELNQDTFSRI